MTKLLVIGEICIDEYIYGTCDRVCPEAAAMCFRRSPEPIKQNYGMAGNVFENIKSIDSSSNISLLSNNKSIQPIIKRRFIDLKYNTIVFREDINDKTQRVNFDNHNLDHYDIIIISDYNKGYLDYEDYRTIRRLSKNATIFADTKKHINNTILDSIDFLKINNKEYFDNKSFLDNKYQYTLIITQGQDGALLVRDGHTTHFPTNPIDVRDVCGAGDTFLAGLVIKYAETKNIEESVIYANKMAGQVVQKFGVTVP
jgi:D-beta-D-heptose 7-phosphate kinase/D-beta-D-heptose 1-phosphate adenosyltransferase